MFRPVNYNMISFTSARSQVMPMVAIRMVVKEMVAKVVHDEIVADSIVDHASSAIAKITLKVAKPMVVRVMKMDNKKVVEVVAAVNDHHAKDATTASQEPAAQIRYGTVLLNEFTIILPFQLQIIDASVLFSIEIPGWWTRSTKHCHRKHSVN